MSEAAPVTVTVGGKPYTLRPFTGLKAVNLMTAIGGVMKMMPDLQDQIQAAALKHRRDNMVEVPRAVLELRNPEAAANVTAEGWEAGNNMILLPDPDASFGFEQMIFSVLPNVMEEARDQALNVLALIVIPDSELRKADEEDNVMEALSVYRKNLLYDGLLEQLAELALASVKLVKGQFEGKVVAELVEQFKDLFGMEDEEEILEDVVPITQVEVPDDHPLNQDPATSSGTLSTSSEPLTDGPAETSSVAVGTTSTDTSSE